MPAQSGASGPITTKSIFSALQSAITALWSAMSSGTHSASCAMPALPGAQIEPVGERARRQLPGQRVLTPAGTDQKNIHAGISLAWLLGADTLLSTASTGRLDGPRSPWFA